MACGKGEILLEDADESGIFGDLPKTNTNCQLRRYWRRLSHFMFRISSVGRCIVGIPPSSIEAVDSCRLLSLLQGHSANFLMMDQLRLQCSCNAQLCVSQFRST